MLIQFISWYLVVQLITLAALPWALRIFANLPDRGYVFARSLGILLVGMIFWLGYSYGLIRNEAGGAWISLVVVAALLGGLLPLLIVAGATSSALNCSSWQPLRCGHWCVPTTHRSITLRSRWT